MKQWITIFIAVGLWISSSRAQAPQSADDILDEAISIAGKEKKNVFIIFHASWCGWCHKMDTAMNDPAVRKFFNDNYVIRHLTVYESKSKKSLENPGAEDLLKRYKGDDEGIPYWMIFDREGQLLADSKIRKPGESLDDGANTGCPAKENEVDHFVKVLKQTSRLKESDLATIKKRFRLNDSH